MPTPADSGTKVQGYKGQVYYGATPTIFANVVDTDITVKADSIDCSDHATVGWKDKQTGLKAWSGTIKANFIQAGVDVQAFFAAISGSTTLAGDFRSEDEVGAINYTGSFVVTDYKHAMPNSGMQTIELSIEGRGALLQSTVVTAG